MSAEPIRDQFVDLPGAMLAARRWLVWLSIPQPGKKPRKVPVYANGRQRNGVLDSDADLAQLASFEEACAALSTGRYAGLGFALGPDGTGQHWQGVDLDDVPNRPELRLLADDLPGYTETSPSGTGMHAVGYGRPFAALGSNGTGIEAYSAGRYFTVTGEGAGLGEPVDIADFVERVLAPRHGLRPAPVSAEVVEYVDQRTLAELRSALAAMRADDRDLWVANGQRLKKLGEPGRALWLEWSQQSDKFDPADAARVWDSFTADRTGHQAIFAEAQRRGWVNPMSAASGAPVASPAPQGIQSALDAAATPFSDDELQAAAIPHPHAFMSPDSRRGLFPEGEVTVLAAPGREGKTTVMTTIAVHYALGLPVGGMPPREVGSVLIYSAEDDRSQYARKIQAHRCKLTEDDGRCLQRNIIVPDLHTPELSAWREIVRLEARQPVRGPILEPLIATIKKLRARECPLGLVIFETASTLSEAEEDNAGLRVLVDALKRIAKACGVPVVLTHHTSQESAKNLPTLDLMESAFRGGTALVNNARQTALSVNLGAMSDPFPDSDARTVLRRLVAPGDSSRISMIATLTTSKLGNPFPLFFRWEDAEPYGPRAIEIRPPHEMSAKSWLGIHKMLQGAKAQAAVDKRAAQGEANVRLVVRAVAELAEAGEWPTVTKVSAKCGRGHSWAKPYLEAAAELGDLVRSTEQVPRVKGMTDVYRPPSDGAKPWEEGDSPIDSPVKNSPPWSQK